MIYIKFHLLSGFSLKALGFCTKKNWLKIGLIFGYKSYSKSSWSAVSSGFSTDHHEALRSCLPLRLQVSSVIIFIKLTQGCTRSCLQIIKFTLPPMILQQNWKVQVYNLFYLNFIPYFLIPPIHPIFHPNSIIKTVTSSSAFDLSKLRFGLAAPPTEIEYGFCGEFYIEYSIFYLYVFFIFDFLFYIEYGFCGEFPT